MGLTVAVTDTPRLDCRRAHAIGAASAIYPQGRFSGVKALSSQGPRERIAHRLDVLGTNATRVSREAKLGNTAVYDIVKGKNKNPSHAILRAIAEVLLCDVAYLTGESDTVHGTAAIRRTLTIRVMGSVEIGVTRVRAKTGVGDEAIDMVVALPHPD